MARKFYAFPAGSGIEIDLDPTLVTPGAKISEDEIRAVVPPGTYILGSADDSIEVVKAGSPLEMLTAPSLTGSMKIGGEAAISPGTFTAGASVSHVLAWQDGRGNDVEFATGATSFLWTSEYDTRPVRVRATATLGAETLVVASPSQAVTYNAPTTQGALLDMVHTEDTGDRTVDVSGDFAVVGDPTLAGITWSVTGTGATISAAGVVTITTADARKVSAVTVTATNSGGSVSSAFDVTVGTPVVPGDLAIRFGALTPTGSGGAQARDGAGAAIDITAITSQPSTRWTLASGKLVATGSPAMASEQITATVDGASVTISIQVVPDMISVADATEFAAVSMTPAGTGDFTIELRAGVVIPKADATTKIAGTSGSLRTLGGILTLTGELESGLPSANIEGLAAQYLSGGKFVLSNVQTSPPTGAGQALNAKILQFDRSPTSDVLVEGVHAVGNPAALLWPGVDPGTGGTNDWGLDPWGGLVRVNAVSGVSRPYVDGQVGSGPDILTFGTSGVKRVLVGIRALSGGEYELQFGDRNGNAHSVSNALVSGEGASVSIVVGEAVSGLDGFAATVIAPPSGVDTAGGYYRGTACYSYLIRGPRWLDTDKAQPGSGTAATVRNLTVRNCDVSGCDSMFHPCAIQSVIVEQNKFHHFTQDCVKIPNPNGNPNFTLIFRRNDLNSSMQSSTDLGAAHTDYFQIYGLAAEAEDWPGLRIHHNRLLCNARGDGQGMFVGPGTNGLTGGQVFGNIVILSGGGNGTTWKLKSDSLHCHNTYLVNRKEEGLPGNWAQGNGTGAAVNFSSTAPGTNVYSGWNAARRFMAGAISTEKNFGTGGNTAMTQDALFVGLGGARPFFFATFEEVMIGAQTTLTGGDDKVGALASNSDWSGYPYRVTTDDAHLPFKLDYDPGDLS